MSTPTTTHQARPRVILAEHVQLALVAAKLNRNCRWAAVSDCLWTTRTCTLRRIGGDSAHKQPPTLQPMQRGHLHRAIERQRLTQGLPSIKATFGLGYKALLAESPHTVPPAAPRQGATR